MGVNAVPGANLANRNLTMAYLIGADLTNASARFANLTSADMSQAVITNVDFPVMSSSPRREVWCQGQTSPAQT